MKQIRKRDGRVVDFDKTKIVNAVMKAMVEANEENEEAAEKIAGVIEANSEGVVDIEDVQDKVENLLMDFGFNKTAKAYILYRDARNKARGRKQADLFNEIIAIKSNDVTRDNANMNADTPAGMMMKFAAETSKMFADDYLLSDEAREALRDNYIWVHDKDYYPTKSLTCIQHPLDKILANGFHAGHGCSRPAKRIETAAILATISMECVQNEMHGGQAIPAFDFMLAPYVKKTWIEEVKKVQEFTDEDLSCYYEFPNDDYEIAFESKYLDHARKMTINRVHQAMESFVHNCNAIHSRGGNQVVFGSINYGTDTSPEGRLIIRETLKTTYDGVGNGETAIFPIQIFKMKSGVSVDPGDPNYDLFELACKVIAKRFFPNFLNLDASYNIDDKWRADDPERWRHEVATMG